MEPKQLRTQSEPRHLGINVLGANIAECGHQQALIVDKDRFVEFTTLREKEDGRQMPRMDEGNDFAPQPRFDKAHESTSIDDTS